MLIRSIDAAINYLRWVFVLGSLFCATGHAAQLPIDFWCGQAPSGTVTQNTVLDWQRTQTDIVPLDPRFDTCWVRINQLPLAPQHLTVENGWANLQLFDAYGNLLARGERVGTRVNTVLSTNHIIFANDPAWALPLYLKVSTRSKGVLIPLAISIQAKETAALIEHDRASANISLAVATAVLVAAFFCTVFGIALRDSAYAWMATYLYLSVVIRVFNPFEPLIFNLSSNFDYARLVSRAMYPLINAVWMLSFARIADFAQFAPRINQLSRLTAMLFILEIPLWFGQGSLGQTINFALIICAAYPLLFLGCWYAWRRGNSAAGILLLSNIMIFTFWGPYQLNELWPTAFFAWLIVSPSLSSILGVTSDLVLPLLFCVALAVRTLNLKQAALRLMSYDILTGLPNREMIRRAGEELLQRGQSFAVLVLNIDRFRAINGALGPEIGDKLLAVAGNRLAAIEGAQVGRLHADQFCLLWTDVSQIATLRARIENDFSHPVDEHGQMVDLTLSIGIVNTNEAGLSMAQLLRRAEIALETGRAQHKAWMEYCVDFEAGRRADLGLLSELSRAVEEAELRMFLQPKVRLTDGLVVSAEALVRWQHPIRGLVGPFEFVPFAEQTGRICLITEWMIASAMKFCAQARAAGSPLQLSVNISAVDLHQSNFVHNLQNLATQFGAHPEDIRLEVTESAAMHDPRTAIEIMQALKNAGFSLSIDDFGTGYSSLAYLQKMPVAELKIDRSFVRDVVAGSDAAVLLKSTIEMAHRLGLSVVAEGAETASEWALLEQLQCDYIQGYFAAKPMQTEAFLLWRKANSPFISRPD